MPYRRARKRSFRRRRFGRKRRVSFAVKRYVKKTIDRNIEDKIQVVDLATVMNSVSTAPTEKPLTNIPQGLTNIARIGNKVKIKSVEIKGVLSVGASQVATDDGFNTFRLVLALWSAYSVAPLTTYSINVGSILDRRLNANLLRRKYLDRIFTLSVSSVEKGAGDGYVPRLVNFHYYKRFKKGIWINYASSGYDQPDKILVLSAVSDSSVVSHPGFTSGFVKVCYEDA